MRTFKQIQSILGASPNVKKIYLIGCTGAGKTSLVQQIIGSKKHDFPVTSQRRTTITPTEYLVGKNRAFKTTIILKKEQDVKVEIEDLIQGAILKAKQDNSVIEDVVFELKQSSDARFKLDQMVSNDTFCKIAEQIIDTVLPSLKSKNISDETLLTEPSVKDTIQLIVKDILVEIETYFNKVCGNGHKLFSEQPIVIEGITNKDDFLNQTKKFLSHEFGSISILAEYVRVEGDLLAEWLEPSLDFLLIDGEGIGFSLGEKRDTLSARHYDYFNYCNSIVLVHDVNDPFAAGGHGAIEGLFLNGYQNKFRLVFSKTDKLEQVDQTAYFRRNLNNLRNALKKEQIIFSVENKDTYKLSALDKNINDESKKSIQNLLKSIFDAEEKNLTPLEYDFDLLFSNFNSDALIDVVQGRIENEHWAVIKALSKRLLDSGIEYKNLKPLSWILMFVMREINLFLQKDDLSSETLDSQNIIKQAFSQHIIAYIYSDFIVNKQHLWQQAYEKKGIGSNKERKDFIFGQILNPFLPKRNKEEAFNLFKNDIKGLLLKSGALELKTAIKTEIKHVSIKKIFGIRNIEWTLGDDVSILIGKNGCGKSTILKLIDACIHNDNETLERFHSPYVELTILKTFDNGETQQSVITQGKSLTNINLVMVNTFDNKTDIELKQFFELDNQLLRLMDKFGHLQRGLTQEINKKVGEKIKLRDNIISDLALGNTSEITHLQTLTTDINLVTSDTNAPLVTFSKIINEFFSGTNKSLDINHETAPMMVQLINDNIPKHIKVTELSSGEKQLLIIFLTVVLERGRSFILLMDEPETSLHVEWQATFIDKIKELNSNVQIIIATHNPLILLNREQDEIGIIEADNECVQNRATGTKYLDISSILLEHFELPSLIGNQMQGDIKKFTELKLREEKLTDDEKIELARIASLLENSLAGDIVYNKKYFEFLTFLKENKKVGLEEYEQATDAEMGQFLSEFGDLFND
ncbi:MAG: AAA family ATPase [Colwellia sp.]|nr:AAA family ATPase [Colwellia sp.]